MDKKITTVKVLSDLYNDFKKLNIDTGFSLQKLVNRSMFLYVNESKLSIMRTLKIILLFF